MDEDNLSALPPEIMRFLENPGGHSLIVRGNAGAGKTTFSLQVAEEFMARQGVHYVSTRVSDGSLTNQFPWLKERLLKSDQTDEHRPKRGGLGKLKGIGTGEIVSPRKEMGISIGRTMADLEMMYDLVENGDGERQMIIVDSIDALADRYDLTCRNLIIALQRDLVEGHGANILFVLESNDHMLDYLGDGVVELSRIEHERRLVREIDLMKLRGCEIQRPLYLFTLKGGRFHSFSSAWERGRKDCGNWTSPPETDDRLSYGITDLDSMTGGLTPGSFVLVEMGAGVPPLVSDLLERSLVLNFATAGRGVLWAPLRKASGSNARASLGKDIGDEEMERTVRIIEPASQMGIDSGRYVFPVEGRSVGEDLSWKSVAFALDRSEKPHLSLLGFDSLESIYGREVMDGLVDHLAAIKKNGGAFIGMTSPTSSSIPRLADLASVHLKVERLGGTVVVYGVKPFTECHALNVERRPRGGCISLTPLV